MKIGDALADASHRGGGSGARTIKLRQINAARARRGHCVSPFVSAAIFAASGLS